MRYAAILLLALVSINAVTAVSLRKNSESMKTSFAIERLRFIGKKSTIAKQIISAVELHLTSGGKVQEVIDLVEQARDDVANRNVALNQEYHDRRSSLEEQIITTENQLNQERDRLQVVNNEIAQHNAAIASLQLQIENLEQELRNLDEREENVNRARDLDVTTYEKRRQRDQNSLNVLEQIISRLLALQQRGNAFLQVSKKEIERILKRIPKSNPIQALVQLSTKFDEATLQRVIEKLQQIQAAVQASFVEDSNGETADKERYDALIAEIHALRAQKTDELNAAHHEKEGHEAEVRQLEEERATLTASIEINEALLARLQGDLENTIASYEARIAEGNEALAAINLALEVLHQNQSELENREQAADIVESIV